MPVSCKQSEAGAMELGSTVLDHDLILPFNNHRDGVLGGHVLVICAQPLSHVTCLSYVLHHVPLRSSTSARAKHNRTWWSRRI